MSDDDIFGDSGEPETERSIGMAVPPRALNSIEQTLLGQMSGMADANPAMPSIPFLDENGDIETAKGNVVPIRQMSARVVMDLRNLLLCDVEKVFRRQLIIARELGETRTDGGPYTPEYEIACMAEGVEPWPVGDKMEHKP